MTEDKKSKKEIEMEKLKNELKEELKKELLEEKKKDNKNFEEKARETVDKIMDTEDSTNDFEKKDIEQNKIMAILSYFGPLSLIPYFAFKESNFVQYHAKQGLNLFIIEFIVGIMSYFLNLIFHVPNFCNVGGVEYICGIKSPLWISIPVDFIQLILGIVAIIGLVYACQGKAKEVPILGKVKIIK